MPTDWQALDQRIARMLEFEQAEVHGAGALFWVSDDGEEYLVERPNSHAWMDWDVWQPHENVAQALKGLETLSSKGVNYRIHRIAKHDVTVQLWGYVHGPFVRPRRTGEFLPETICLVVEAWLDAQGLPDGASG